MLYYLSPDRIYICFCQVTGGTNGPDCLNSPDFVLNECI